MLNMSYDRAGPFPRLCRFQEGAFSFVFKSVHYPGEVVVARRGSPLLIGVKTEKKLKVDFVDVEFGGAVDGGDGPQQRSK